MPSKPMTLEQLFKETDSYLIGVWRFRERGRPPLWCATFVMDGYYYDVSGQRALRGVLTAVRREIVPKKTT